MKIESLGHRKNLMRHIRTLKTLWYKITTGQLGDNGAIQFNKLSHSMNNSLLPRQNFTTLDITQYNNNNEDQNEGVNKSTTQTNEKVFRTSTLKQIEMKMHNKTTFTNKNDTQFNNGSLDSSSLSSSQVI